MGNEIKLNPEQEFAQVIAKTNEQYPIWVERAGKAVIALSKIQKIETPEEDEYAKKVLLGVKKAYDEVSSERLAVTSKLDEIKTILMEPEKRISLQASHKESEGLRVKLLRDGYATFVFNEAQEKQKKLLSEQNKKEELARLDNLFADRFFEETTKQLVTMENNIEAFFNKLILDDFEEKIKKLSVKPKLSNDFYESLFIVDYDKTKINATDFNAYLSNIKAQYPYDGVNAIYVEKAEPIFKVWKDKLPNKKKELEDMAELAKTNKEEAERKQKEINAQQLKDKEAREQSALQEVENNKLKNAQEANVKVVDAQFEAQVGSQSIASQKNIRQTKQATITAEKVNTVKVLSQVMFACYTNPKFKGHIKVDRATGVELKDADGRPVYEDWAETLLDFYANNCDVAIDGVAIKTIVSTIQKK